MLTSLLAPAAAFAALALQASPAAPDAAPAEPAFSLDALPVEQAATARCAIAFATISRWQKTGDARGKAYPDMEASGGREFFVRAMARLMDDAGLSREDVMTLSFDEVQRNETPEGTERVVAMMPACTLMKSAAGL